MFLLSSALAATVSGRFDAPLATEVALIDDQGVTVAVAPVEDGAFRVDVPLDRFAHLKLRAGTRTVRQLFLKADDTLALTIHAVDGRVREVTFDGSGAARNTAAETFEELYWKNGGFDDRYRNAANGTQDDFLAAEREVVRAQRRWIAAHPELGEGAARWLAEWVELSSAERTVLYVMTHEIQTEEVVVPTGRFRRVIAALPPKRPALVGHPAYLQLLRTGAYRWHLDAEERGAARYRAVWARIDRALRGEPRDLMRYAYLSAVLEDANTDEELTAVASLVEQVVDPRVAELREALAQRTALGPGRPAPDFTLPDPAGQPVSLSSFAGQVVVLDFWGTWCGPCMEALPAVHALQEELADEPVAFVFVALEVERRARWLRFLEERGLASGTHLYAEGGFRSQALAAWGLSSAPTYAVIDRDGRIVSASAPAPGAGLEELVRATLAP